MSPIELALGVFLAAGIIVLLAVAYLFVKVAKVMSDFFSDFNEVGE